MGGGEVNTEHGSIYIYVYDMYLFAGFKWFAAASGFVNGFCHRNSFIFKTCISRAKLDIPSVEQRPQVRLQMTSQNWSRIHEAHESTPSDVQGF